MEKKVEDKKTESKEMAKITRDLSDKVLNKVNVLQEESAIQLPTNYAVGNALKAAILVLQEQVTKDGKPVLTACTQDSIANALFDMVIQGLSVSKKQGYFIPYGGKLNFSRSYFGSVALAKRTGRLVEDPVAVCIYEKDEFIYEISPETGRLRIISHKQQIENIDGSKIKAVYVICKLAGDKTDITLMTMNEIRKSWEQGATKGNSPAHKNFPQEMAKKTAIGKACKMIINASDDSWLYDGLVSDDDPVTSGNSYPVISASPKKEFNEIQEADAEDITDKEPSVANDDNLNDPY